MKNNKDEYRKQVNSLKSSMKKLKKAGYKFQEDDLPDEQPARPQKQQVDDVNVTFTDTRKKLDESELTKPEANKVTNRKPAANNKSAKSVTPSLFSGLPTAGSGLRTRMSIAEQSEAEKEDKVHHRKTRKYKKTPTVVPQLYDENGNFIELPRSQTDTVDSFIERAKQGFTFADPVTGEIVKFQAIDFDRYERKNLRTTEESDGKRDSIAWFKTLDNFIEENPELEDFIRAKFPLYNNYVNKLVEKEQKQVFQSGAQPTSTETNVQSPASDIDTFADYSMMDEVIINNFRSDLAMMDIALGTRSDELRSNVDVLRNWLDHMIEDNGIHDVAQMLEEGVKEGLILRRDLMYDDTEVARFITSLTALLPDQGEEYTLAVEEMLETGVYNKY